MSTLISLLVVGAIAFVVVKSIKSKSIGETTESIIKNLNKKFNKLVSKISPRTVDTIKAELLEVLDEYKVAKTNEFIEGKQLINSNIKMIESSSAINIVTKDSLKSKLKAEIATNPGSNLSAQYLYQINKLNEANDELSKLKVTMKEKDTEIDNQINLFGSKLAIKRSEVISLICNNVINNTSTVDLTLNDLMIEFKSVVDKKNIETEVKSKINNVDTNNDQVDLDTYKEKVKVLTTDMIDSL